MQESKAIVHLNTFLTSGTIQRLYSPLRKTPLSYIGYQRRLAEQRSRRLPIARDLSKRIMLNSDEVIVLEYDNTRAAPAFGEYSELVLFARFLEVNGFKVKIVVLDHEGMRESAWVRSSSEQQREFLDFQLEFPKILGIKDTSRIDLRESNRKTNQHASLDEWCRAFGYQAYRLAPDILEEMIGMMGKEVKISEFLLNSKTDYLDSNYVTYNYRRNLSWDKTRNQSDDEVISDLLLLNEAFPDFNQVILSDTEGSRYFNEEIKIRVKSEAHQLEKVQISTQPKAGFLEAVRLVLTSRFHFHRRGGGIQAPLIYSHTPYLVLTTSVYSHIHRKGSKFHSFSKDNQFVSGRNLSQVSLRKVLQHLVIREED